MKNTAFIHSSRLPRIIHSKKENKLRGAAEIRLCRVAGIKSLLEIIDSAVFDTKVQMKQVHYLSTRITDNNWMSSCFDATKQEMKFNVHTGE